MLLHERCWNQYGVAVQHQCVNATKLTLHVQYFVNVIETQTAKISIHNRMKTILLRVTEKVYTILERDFISNKIEILKVCLYSLWQCLLNVFVHEIEFSRFTIMALIYFSILIIHVLFHDIVKYISYSLKTLV